MILTIPVPTAPPSASSYIELSPPQLAWQTFLVIHSKIYPSLTRNSTSNHNCNPSLNPSHNATTIAALNPTSTLHTDANLSPALTGVSI